MSRVQGLPGRLPEGERVLWQGRPDARVVMRRVFHLRLLAAYFAAILLWSAAGSLGRGVAAGDVALSALRFAALAAVPLGLLGLYAWGIGRTTLYTVTNRRVAIRFGVALPMTVNLPFARIDGAGFRPARDGSGDIALQLTAGDKVAYLVLWPHARPWRLARPEPMLRALPDAAAVAQVLSRALAASADAPAPVIGQLQAPGHTGTIAGNRPQAAAA